MPWVRVDDAFYDHPKWIEAGPLAGWLGMCALAWCNRNQTDGFITYGKVQLLADFGLCAEIDDTNDPSDPHVSGWRVSPYALADRLVDVGLWERADGGFLIHDYLGYQKSAAQIKEIAMKRAESGRKGGLSNAEAPVEGDDQQTGSKPEAKPEAQSQSQSQEVLSEPPRGAASGAAPKRGCRIPDRFTVDEGMERWAKSQAPDVDWAMETRKFVNYWKAKPGKDAVKLDWGRTWQNWLLSAQGRTNGRGAVRTHL